MTTPLADALERAWDHFGGREGLLSGLAFDAVAARIAAADDERGAVRAAAARLLELLVSDSSTALGNAPRWAPAEVLAAAGWSDWSGDDRAVIGDVIDAWWAVTLALEPRPPGVEVVLGSLVRLGTPLVRWLEPWLADLDGPPAVHLAELVLGGLADPVWEGHADERGQVVAWLRTEPVVMGIVVVGGIHLDDGVLSQVLEEILE